MNTVYVLVFVLGLGQTNSLSFVIPDLANYAECKRVEMILTKEYIGSYNSRSICLEVLK